MLLYVALNTCKICSMLHKNDSREIQISLWLFYADTLKKKFDDTDIIMVPWPILYRRFTENQSLLASVQPVCVLQPYTLLLQQYVWLTVKYILLNYLKIFSYIQMADKSQAFLSVYIPREVHAYVLSALRLVYVI